MTDVESGARTGRQAREPRASDEWAGERVALMQSGEVRERSHVWWVSALLFLYLLLAVAYGVIAPPFESPDEVGHVFTIKYVADNGRLPPPDKATADELLYGQEGTQPPLYYMLGAVILRASGVQTDDAWELRQVNPHTTCGSPSLEGNKAFLAHDPARERFPWSDSILAVHVLRLYSTALGLATLVGVYGVARVCSPRREGVAVLAVGLTVLNPQFLFVSAGVNNDNLLVPLCAWGLFLLVGFIRHRPRYGWVGIAGVVVGLAALTKVGGLLLLPVATLAIIAGEWNRSQESSEGQPKEWRDLRRTLANWPSMFSHFLVLAGAAIAVAGWWYVRNAIVYGDPMLLEHHLDIVSRRDPTPLGHILREIPSIFYSYWGRFTCDISPGGWYYVFWGLTAVAGVGGVIASWRKLSVACRLGLLLLLTWFAAVFAGWFRWNLAASGVQGRLLFPAAVSVGVVVGCGLAEWTHGRRWVRAVLLLSWLGLSLGMLYGLIRPTFIPPSRYLDGEGIEIPSRIDWAFVDGGERIQIVGFDIQPTSLGAGDELEVTLYLSTPSPIPETYSLGLWLVSAVPGQTARLAGLDTWPGNGNYPTTAWRPGEVIVDKYRIAIPSQVEGAQAWLVQINAYRMGKDTWLQFAQEGETRGDRAVLGLVRVGASTPVNVPSAHRLEPSPVFGSAIALRGVGTEYEPDTRVVRLSLWWEALSPVGGDYTVFAHLLDEGGEMLGNGDGPPMKGGFPTGMWEPGDVVVDAHEILVSPDLAGGEYDIAVGWYDAVSGMRLLTEHGDSVQITDAVQVR